MRTAVCGACASQAWRKCPGCQTALLCARCQAEDLPSFMCMLIDERGWRRVYGASPDYLAAPGSARAPQTPPTPSVTEGRLHRGGRLHRVVPGSARAYEMRDCLRANAAAQRAAALEEGCTPQDSHRLRLDKKYAKRTAKRFAAMRRSPQALPGPGRQAEEKKMNAKE